MGGGCRPAATTHIYGIFQSQLLLMFIRFYSLLFAHCQWGRCTSVRHFMLHTTWTVTFFINITTITLRIFHINLLAPELFF